MQLRIARQMLAAKLPLQQISEMTALSMSELKSFKNTEINTSAFFPNVLHLKGVFSYP